MPYIDDRVGSGKDSNADHKPAAVPDELSPLHMHRSDTSEIGLQVLRDTIPSGIGGAVRRWLWRVEAVTIAALMALSVAQTWKGALEQVYSIMHGAAW